MAYRWRGHDCEEGGRMLGPGAGMDIAALSMSSFLSLASVIRFPEDGVA